MHEYESTKVQAKSKQSIIIKQGSGATVTIPNGMTKMVVLDGAGAGAAVFDCLDYLDLTSNVKQQQNSATSLLHGYV